MAGRLRLLRAVSCCLKALIVWLTLATSTGQQNLDKVAAPHSVAYSLSSLMKNELFIYALISLALLISTTPYAQGHMPPSSSLSVMIDLEIIDAASQVKRIPWTASICCDADDTDDPFT